MKVLIKADRRGSSPFFSSLFFFPSPQVNISEGRRMRKLRFSSRRYLFPWLAHRNRHAISSCSIVCTVFSPHYSSCIPAAFSTTTAFVDAADRLHPHRCSLTDSPRASNNVASQPFHPCFNHPFFPSPSPHRRMSDCRRRPEGIGVVESRAISAADKMSLA